MGGRLDTVLDWTRDLTSPCAANRTVQGAAAERSPTCTSCGELQEARHWADVSVEMAEAIGHALVLPPSAAIAALARLELGEPVDAARHLEALEQAAASTVNTSLNLRFIGEALFALGDRERAERYAEALRAVRSAAGCRRRQSRPRRADERRTPRRSGRWYGRRSPSPRPSAPHRARARVLGGRAARRPRSSGRWQPTRDARARHLRDLGLALRARATPGGRRGRWRGGSGRYFQRATCS